MEKACYRNAESLQPEEYRQAEQLPADLSEGHDVTLMHAVLQQNEDLVREMELAKHRRILKKSFKGIVGAVDYGAYRVHDAGNGMAGAVDRAEEALRHEKALTRIQRALTRSGRAVGSVWESGGAYLTDRANRIGHALENAHTAVRNKETILRGSKAAHWLGNKLESFRDTLDRTLPN